MGIIKLAFISAIVFFLIITGISLFIPSHIRISKAIDINTSKKALAEQLANAANWKNWYPGADSASLYFINGEVKGMTTKSRQSLIIKGVNDSAVIVETKGTNNKISNMGWNFFEASTPNTVTVQWYMDFHLRWYPWEKFSGIMFEKRYGPLMEQGLKKLKAQLEK